MSMENFVDKVVEVSDWALVKIKPAQICYAKSRLTLSVKDENGPAKTLYQYRVPNRDLDKSGQLMYIPRALVGHLEDKQIGVWKPMIHRIKSKWTDTRPGQKKTIEDFITGLETHKYGGIIQAVTGAGKTVMALDIACRLNMPTLIVVPRTSLMAQWKEQILKWTTAKEDDIGTFQGSTRIWKDKQFCVAMIHTLAQNVDEIDPYFLSNFGLVIFDECHVVGAETFSRVAPLFWCKYRLGLSATPRRADGMDPVFYWHIGPILARFTKLQAKARVRILPYRGKDTDHKGCVWSGKLNLGRYFNRIAASAPRFELVKKIIHNLNTKDHEILVLADRIEYLKSLQRALIADGVEEDKVGLLIGKVKQLDRKIILGTYGSASMGVDIPRLSALVLASPHADIEQAVGRVLRQGSPIVVDVVDVASSIMIGWSRARKKFFRKITDDIQDRSVIG
jgi:superfamily II DNA or RNA helicase